MLDLLIRNARIVDGTGAPWFHGSLGVRDGLIAGLNPPEGTEARSVVDADGAYLTPGFIDSHTHDDTALLREPLHPSKVHQGVTTVVVGNCSFSNYPLTPASDLPSHYQGLLGDTPDEHFFTDLGGYAQALNARGCGVNVVSLVGHASLRLAVLGYDPRPATAAERASMMNLLDEQLLQGAHGLSLGLVYPPSAYADEAELLSLARQVRRRDALLTAHVRSYEGALIESVREFLQLLEVSGARGLLSHLQAAGRPYWGSVGQALELIEQARSRGVDVSVDMYPYPAGSSSVTQLLPPSAQSQGIEGLAAQLGDPVRYAELQALTERGREPGWESKIALIGWENVQIGGVLHPELKPLEGLSLSRAAAQLNCDPFALIARMIELDHGASNIIMFQLSEDDLRAVHQHRLHMLGSDSIPRCGGKPHPRMYGSFPRMLGRFVQDGILHLEDAVRRVTSLPAQRFGLWERGLLRPGSVADLCLFTPEFMDRATFAHPEQFPRGLRGVWVGGTRTLADGQQLPRQPGRLLLHPSQENTHA